MSTAPEIPESKTQSQKPKELLPPVPTVTRVPLAKHTVHWFRKGLRLHDNPSLREGLLDAATFRCIFIIDPWFASSSNVGINKWRFLLECLADLDKNLRKLNSRLFVVRGQPADALPKLFLEWGTTTLSFEEDPEPYGRVRDHNISLKCREVGISVISRVSHTLYKLDTIIESNGGKAPLTYHQFQALIAGLPSPPPSEEPISLETLNGATTPISRDHEDRFGVPTLEELGFETEGLKPPIWLGGESEALARLNRHLERKAWVASFGRPKMTPQSLLASQTGLSPYLRFGCLSTRLFYYQLTELYERIKQVQPPLSLHGQILWREFFYCAATRNPHFDQMVGNPICVQIPWEKNQEALAKWANGQTGYPWIDAIMIQLRQEGWIHHLARHAVACFLTRGDLWISWEEGMKVFDELMLDADWSVNAGMWMWLSCSSFFQQFFHCYCPVRFGRKTDPNGDFIRRYIPALKDMPTRYIHEPWMAPESVQEAAHCVMGRDYPMPMIDHAKASQTNLERIRLVYAQLAKYKPQGIVQTNSVNRPNVTQSSPSPTSIIASINQSNFMCRTTSAPQSAPLQNNNKKPFHIFQRPTIGAVHAASKHSKLKQVVIVRPVPNSEVLNKNISEDNSRAQKENYMAHNQKNIERKTRSCSLQASGLQTPNKQAKLDHKNVVINPIQGLNNGILYKSQKVNQKETHSQQGAKSNNNNAFGYEKAKFYLSQLADSKIIVSSSPEIVISAPTNGDTSLEANAEVKDETTKDETDDSDSMNVVKEESISIVEDLQNAKSPKNDNNSGEKNN